MVIPPPALFPAATPPLGPGILPTQIKSCKSHGFHFKSSKSLQSEPWGVPVRWHERRAPDPEVTVWSFRHCVKWGGPCILCSRVWRACSASGLNTESERKGKEVECNWQSVNFFTSLYVSLCCKLISHKVRGMCFNVLPSPGLVGDAQLSLLDSRAILFRANKALPAFYLTTKKSGKKTPLGSINGRVNMKTVHWGVTFHFCRARNFFIFSFDRFLASSSPESKAAIHGWASACSQIILLLGTIPLAG